MKLNYNKAEFAAAYGKFSQVPAPERIEIAFAGHSNVGKSTLINKLFNRKNLARVSSVPGKTATINFYSLENIFFVDLPGYGYAKVPLAMKKKWQQALNEYLERRQSLIGLVVVMDIRNPLTMIDRQIVNWSIACGLPTILLLTKADKLNQGPRQKVLNDIRFQLQEFENADRYVKVIAFSSLNHSIGVKTLKQQISDLFNDCFTTP